MSETSLRGNAIRPEGVPMTPTLTKHPRCEPAWQPEQADEALARYRKAFGGES